MFCCLLWSYLNKCLWKSKSLHLEGIVTQSDKKRKYLLMLNPTFSPRELNASLLVYCSEFQKLAMHGY